MYEDLLKEELIKLKKERLEELSDWNSKLVWARAGVRSEKLELFEQEVKDAKDTILAIDNELASRKEREKTAKSSEKEEEAETASSESKWSAFQNAFKIYESTGMCFLRNANPCYFYKLTLTDIDRKTGSPRIKTSIEKQPAACLGLSYPELNSRLSQHFFRLMVRGDKIVLTNPETDEVEAFQFPTREYVKLVNTRHTPDPLTYNLVDLSNIMQPEDGKFTTYSLELRALLIALSGSKLVKKDGKWIPTKPEVIRWLEKWIYAVTYADPGNNFLSMPILFGRGKKGKNALFDKVIPGLLGRTQCFSGVWDIIDSSFNGFKLGKLFVFIDEIPAREEWTKIKNQTGSVIEYIKEKYGLEYEIDNTIAYAMGSNQIHFPLPIEDGKQMMRVSPIDLNHSDTFAEAAYKLLNEQIPNYVEDTLIKMKIDLKDFPTEFDKGDIYLRQTESKWCGNEALQLFANYLHSTYKTDGKFVLEPLRGTDWDKIVNSRPNAVSETIDFIQEKDPDAISIKEIMEIYKTKAKNPKSDLFAKSEHNLAAEVGPRLEELGYQFNPRKRVKVKALDSGLRIEHEVKLWFKPNVNTRNYQIDITKYVRTSMAGGSNTIRELVYETKATVEDVLADLKTV